MKLAQNKEEKKNLFWKLLIAVSSVLLIAIAAYFIYQLFTSNPLEGEWSYEDSDMLMHFKDEETVELTLSEYFEGEKVTIVMACEVNVDAKTLTLHMSEGAISTAADQTDGKVSAVQIRGVASALEGTYDYNIEQNRLTLTEREYGEQMIFDRQ